MSIEFEVNNKEFNRDLEKATRGLSDLTVPLKEMTREWFKGNRSIFDEGRKGPGKYPDLSPKYKTRKKKLIGSAYPILRGFIKKKGQPARKSGKLADSMINPSSGDSVNIIANKRELILGTKVKSSSGAPYANYLHFGTGNMPSRKFVLIGGEQVATKEINQRRKNWLNLLNDWAFQLTEKEIIK